MSSNPDDLNDRDEREELVARFMRETRNNKHDTFFSESELTDIFDFANDFDNDYLRSEVLHYGAIRYPDSEPLLVRRAYQQFMSGADPALVQRTLAATSADNVLAEILRTRVTVDDSRSDTELRLERILDMVQGEFADEEIIQLVDVASEKGCLGWLQLNYDRIMEKVSYKPTFIYELADVLIQAKDQEGALEQFEKLTEIEPFNIEFWNHVAETAGALSDYERALESSDFALAIDPDNHISRLNKARALFALQKNPDEIVRLLEVMPLDDLALAGTTMPLELLASTYSCMLHDNAKSIEMLKRANDMVPGDPDLLGGLVQLFADDLFARVVRFAELHKEMSASDWVVYAESIGPDNNPISPPAMAILLEAYFSQHLTDPLAYKMFEHLYYIGEYDKVSEYGERLETMMAATESSEVMHPTIVLTRVLAHIRLKGETNIRRAENLIAYGLLKMPQPASFDQIMARDGYKNTLFRLAEFLMEHRNPRKSSIDRLDPFPNYERDLKK